MYSKTNDQAPRKFADVHGMCFFKSHGRFTQFSTLDNSKAIQTTQKEKSNISEKETEDELSAIALARRTL